MAITAVGGNRVGGVQDSPGVAASPPQKVTFAQLQGKDRLELSPDALLKLTENMLRTSIGEKLSAQFDGQGVSLEDAVGIDMSPEATAQRIVSFATGLKDTFIRQNQDLSEEQALSKFEDTIRGAVTQGFGQAQELLEGMGYWNQTKTTAQDTLDRVKTLFDEYFAEQRGTADEVSTVAGEVEG